MEWIEYGNPTASTVLIQPVDAHDLSVMESEIAAIRKMAAADFRLLAVKVDSWNRDLSPWSAPPVFGREVFGEGAEDTLAEIMPLCRDKTRQYILGGYSLAGLFSLWAASRTDAFAGVSAASPSVWFPGFTAYLKDHPLQCGPVYLSLGDREEKTRNPVMAAVGSCIRETRTLLEAAGHPCILEWNQGNHFQDPDLRTARAFAWVMEKIK